MTKRMKRITVMEEGEPGVRPASGSVPSAPCSEFSLVKFKQLSLSNLGIIDGQNSRL